MLNLKIMLIYDKPLMSGQPSLSGHLPASLVWPPKGGLANEQALYLRDIVKSGRARGEAKTGDGPSRLRRSLARLASLAQIRELARRLKEV